MQTSISARHGHLSAATQGKITDKVEKLRRFFDRLTAIQVTLDLGDPDSVDVEVRVSAERAKDFVASETSNELFAGLDGAVQKVEQQLRRHKEKIQTGHRQPGRKQIEPPLEPEAGIEQSGGMP
ncbi:MAG: ribosome hibernation-promoting factor, HPF/YfiA family [Pirellulaceae bacterium]